MKNIVLITLLLLPIMAKAESLLSLIKRTPKLGKCVLEARMLPNKNLLLSIDGMSFKDVDNIEVEANDRKVYKDTFKDNIHIIGPAITKDRIVVVTEAGELKQIKGSSTLYSRLVIPTLVRVNCKLD
jgi:hypothetical protein